MALDKRKRCPVKDYAQQVIAGKIVAGRLVRLACERHMRDLETGHERGLVFDRAAAEFAIEKIQIFRQSKGEFGGKPLVLGDWQKFIVGNLFGWKKDNGTRRFRDGYAEVAKKNGKSTLLGGISDYMLYFDGEPGAEIYNAATALDQAKIVFEEAKAMILALPKQWRIRKRLQIFGNCILFPETNSKLAPLASAVHTVDGKNPHFVCVDEYHRHSTAKLYNVLKKSMASRLQPLLLAITTAGESRASPCWRQREYSIRVLEGVYENDAHFAYIAALDEGDDWKDERNWIKANPNLGVSPKIEALQEEFKTARDMPSELNDFLRYHMNMWVEGDSAWLKAEAWDECLEEFTAESLHGRKCWGGLDLSTTQDTTAFALVFPPTEIDPKWRVLTWFWVPKENIQRRSETDRVPYDQWVREGYITATEGFSVDYDFVEADILKICKDFDVQDVGYDRYGASQIKNNLIDEGLPVVEFGQGYISMSAPTKQLGDLVVDGEIAHNGNPVLRWMMGNVVVSKDPAGNLKPNKEKAREKIDGPVAIIMGIGRADVSEEEPESYTATHGVIFA